MESTMICSDDEKALYEANERLKELRAKNKEHLNSLDYLKPVNDLIVNTFLKPHNNNLPKCEHCGQYICDLYCDCPESTKFRKDKMILNRLMQIIPPKFKTCTLENFVGLEKIHNFNKCLEFKRGTGLLLSGGCGVGKTHLAIAWIRAYSLKMRPDGIFITTMSEIINKWLFDSEKSIIQADLLLIDDLGAENYKDETVQKKTYEVLNYRYNHQLTTVITTNLNAEELPKLIGTRSVSRIMEVSHLFKIKGDDYRMKNKVGG